MDLDFQISKREKLSDQLYGQLLEKIVSGELKEGYKLPSENEISRAFNVSRPVIREALLRLQADGLVYSRQGAGSFVKARPPESLIKFTSPSDISGLLRCFEARLPLEGAAAALAAQRATEEEVETIRKTLVAMEEAMEKGEIADKADFDFHMAIANATGNEFYVSILGTLHTAMRSGMRVALNITKAGSKQRMRKVQEEHRTIYDAISLGDVTAADLAMRYHIQSARTRLMNHQRDI
ncbi:FadR/GntR family transcriptional regulator [Leucothrix pacifica]|uniref:FadR family transcriptional regulator n=1 Tax=Leucothrix pacifica TaxID=1247513 RepID=A0A317C0A4_9GAMM|nr:FadR/GntR family transcriptional regulator [Leucothrix pacifica]PWQ92086.1 FadR family transcriptional regulator [Leucothrix pacifica]